VRAVAHPSTGHPCCCRAPAASHHSPLSQGDGLITVACLPQRPPSPLARPLPPPLPHAHHDVAGVALLLPKHAGLLALDVPRSDLPPIVLGQDGELDAAAPVHGVHDPVAVGHIVHACMHGVAMGAHGRHWAAAAAAAGSGGGVQCTHQVRLAAGVLRHLSGARGQQGRTSEDAEGAQEQPTHPPRKASFHVSGSEDTSRATTPLQ